MKVKVTPLKRRDGFALPTILIASIILVTVLVAAVSATSSINVAINSEYYNRVAKEAAESGLAYAQNCAATVGVNWSSTAPLGPNTDCSGNVLFPCPDGTTDTRCFVLDKPNIRSTFSVGLRKDAANKPTDFIVTSSTSLRRQSTGQTWKQYTSSIKAGMTQGSTPINVNLKRISSSYGNNNSESSTCGLSASSTLFCWGDNSSGQLGNNSTVNSSVPVAVYAGGILAGKTLTSVSVGYLSACAVDTAGQAYCWGANTYGQLGNNSTVNSSVPVAVYTGGVLAGKTLTSVSVGYSTACAVDTAGQAYCWGNNAYGQIGNNTFAGSSVPVAVYTGGVLAGKTLTTVWAGYLAACVVDTAGQAYCWGYNPVGQLGNNSTANSSVPVAVYTGGVLAGKTLTTISVGYSSSCAVDTAGQAYCWGQNYYGQLGNNSSSNSSVPVAVYTGGVLSGKTLTSVAVGYLSACTVDTAGQAYCWGASDYGQLGNNPSSNSSVPVAVYTGGVLAGKTLTTISGAYLTECALDSASQAYCWGNNSSGQLGNGTTINSSVPVTVSNWPPAPPASPAPSQTKLLY